MTTLDLIGHCAYLSLMVGMVLIARGRRLERRLGWAFRIAGDVAWTLLGLALGLSSVAVWGTVFVVVDVVGLHTAEKKRTPTDRAPD